MLFRNQMSALVELQKAEPKAGALFMFLWNIWTEKMHS